MASKTATNLRMEQGATFSLSVVWNDESGVPRDLTGYTARMQIRPAYSSNTITESMSTANGEITVTANTGRIDVLLSATRTAAISVNTASTTTKPPKTTYVYDLEAVSSGGVVKRLIWGNIDVFAEVTK